MNIQLIRNATLKIQYAGKTLLIDPMFCDKHTFDPFLEGLDRNPTNDLNLTISEIINGVDAALVTHSHPDHLDHVAAEALSNDLPIFGTPSDQEFLKSFGFTNITLVEKDITWEGIKIHRIEGQHGSGPVLQYMGLVSGFILQADNCPTIYIVSDSILTENVKSTIQRFNPEIIITNSGGGIIPGFENTPVIMDEGQTIEVCKLSPHSKVLAVHLESIDFCRVTRKSLRTQANQNGISENQLLIPEDGEIINF